MSSVGFVLVIKSFRRPSSERRNNLRGGFGCPAFFKARMRNLTDHIVSGDQAVQLSIEVRDEPGAGGANHRYLIRGFDDTSNPSNGVVQGDKSLRILFQNGPIKESGVNGITQEALLAIVIDRLRSFQNGPFACEDNGIALDATCLALKTLQKRTIARIARGVEGTHQK